MTRLIFIPLVAAIVAVLFPASAALAQQQGPAGRWQCQFANQTVSNNAFENWIYEFALSLNTNGSFQAQGNYNAQTNGFSIPFYAEGRWQQKPTGIEIVGKQQQQGNGVMDFVLWLTNVADRTMSSQYQSANGKLLTYCQR